MFLYIVRRYKMVPVIVIRIEVAQMEILRGNGKPCGLPEGRRHRAQSQVHHVNSSVGACMQHADLHLHLHMHA